MPLPTPHSGETEDDFVSRCMENDTMMEDFPDNEQRLAVCFRQWREERGADQMERKNLNVEIKDAEKGIVAAAFAKLEVKDYDDDWTLKGAFGEQKVRVSSYGHSSWADKLPVGKGVIREVDGEAVAELKFFMSTPHGREHFETIKEMGDLQEWSYGFDVLETAELTDELREKGVRRVLKKLKVHEVSPVLLGAGVDTRTLAIKALEDPLIVPIRFQLVEDLKEEKQDDDPPRALEIASDAPVTDADWDGPAEVAAMDVEKLRKSTLAFMGGDPELKGNYKLPYRDNEGRINASAVRNIRARLSQTDLPGSIRADVERNTERLMEIVQEHSERATEADMKEPKQAIRPVTEDIPITEDEWDGPAEFAAMEVLQLKRSTLLFSGGDSESKESYSLLYRDRQGRINTNAVRSVAARVPEIELPKEIRDSLRANVMTLMDLVDGFKHEKAEAEAKKAAEEKAAQEEASRIAAMEKTGQEEWERFTRNMKRSGRRPEP